jgi:hypothetical protein
MRLIDAVPQSRYPGTPDHALAVERVLQALVVDVLVEHIGDRRVEEDVDHPLVVTEQRLDLFPHGGFADPGVATSSAQSLPHLVEDVLVGPVAVDVVSGKPHRVEARLRLRVIEPCPNDPPSETAPRLGRRCTPRPAPRTELVDHQLIEQPDDVRARLTTYWSSSAARACTPRAAPADTSTAASLERIAGREAVVPAADDHGVPMAGRQ